MKNVRRRKISEPFKSSSANLLVLTNGHELLKTFISAAHLSFDVDVKAHRVEGVIELHAKRVGDKTPAGVKVVLVNPKAVLNDVQELAGVFNILVNNVLAYKGSGVQGEWQPLPT